MRLETKKYSGLHEVILTKASDRGLLLLPQFILKY